MKRFFRAGALLVAAVGAATSGHPARATEVRCWNGDQERRIEVSGPDAARSRACEVRYWRDARVSDSGRILWYAEQNTEFCMARTLELVARLEAGGWICGTGEQAAAPETARTDRAAPPEAAEASMPSPPALAALDPARPGEARDTAPPEAAEATMPSAPALAARDPVRPAFETRDTASPEHEAPSAVVTSERSLAARAPIEAPPPGEPIVPRLAHPAAALLNEVLQETLRSVEQLYGGEFQAEHAAFGDLDGDGLEDAAVLITYQAARDDYVQYLVAYRFDGESFQSIATKNVGGRFLDASRADLEGIADRRILVELEPLDGGVDCCATRRAAFVLQGGHLIEVAEPGAPEGEEASQAERSSPG